jgi:DNA-binding response OmpR family regulator
MAQCPHVLVVEDERLVAELLANALEDAYSVTVANTSAAALLHLQQTPFAAVLLDCLVPDGNAAEIIASAEARDIPVILMSGDPEQIATFSADGHPFLAKPFSIERLQKALRAVLT